MSAFCVSTGETNSMVRFALCVSPVLMQNEDV